MCVCVKENETWSESDSEREKERRRACVRAKETKRECERYDKLAEECDLDYIVVDLPPDHERLTMFQLLLLIVYMPIHNVDKMNFLITCM